MISLCLLFLLNFISGVSSRFTLNPNNCEIQNTKNNCLDIWGCMWCNDTEVKNVSGECRLINICHPPKHNSSCTISDYDYETECYLSNMTFNILIFLAFWSSIYIMLYYTHKLLSQSGMNNSSKGIVLCLIFLILFFPTLFLYITPSLVFYYWLLAIIFVSIIYCGSYETYNYKHSRYQMINQDAI